MEFYNKIYNSDEDFVKYEESMHHTMYGKVKLVESVLKEIKFSLSDKKICLIPCDIGLYYKIFYKLIPDNTFYLLDKSFKPLDYIWQKNQPSNIKIQKVDVCEPFKSEDSFDLAISILALHLFEDIEVFFKNIFNNLENDGQFICIFLSVHNAKRHIMSKFFNQQVNKFYSESEIDMQVRKIGFKEVEIKPIELELKISKEIIPLIYNRFSNSYLYQQKESKVIKFQEYLAGLSDKDYINLKQEYTMIKGKGK